MSRKASPTPALSIHLHLPAEIGTRLQLYLFSEVEGKVPYGAYQAFVTARLQEFFSGRLLDLAPWTGQPECANLVRGNQATIELLTALLEGDRK
jgi:hypothetical protein